MPVWLGRKPRGSVSFGGLSVGGGGSAPLAIIGSPPTATIGIAYTFTPTAIGGFGARSFSLDGTLPDGLSFNTATGAITGAPTTAGTTLGLSITVADDTGSAGLGPFSLTVVEPGAVSALMWGADGLFWGADRLVWS